MDIDFYRHYARAAETARGPAWRYDEMKPCGFNDNNFLLARAGFQIDAADYKDEFLAAYVCTKKSVSIPVRSPTVTGQQQREERRSESGVSTWQER
jgi:hypothetical protein